MFVDATPVLQYDKALHRLWFPYQKGGYMPYPFTVATGKQGYVTCYSARYPMSLIGTKIFKNVYPKGMATKEALVVISQAKEAESEIAEKKIVTSVDKNLFRVKPYEHQLDAIEHMMHYERLALLLEQGLGKTFISIMATVLYRELGIPHRALVICPNIVFQNWIEEVGKYSDLRVLPFKGNPKERTEQRTAIQESRDWDLVLTTFDMLNDKTKTNSFVFNDAWTGMGTQKQMKYAGLWYDREMITKEQYALLLNPKKTQLYRNACVKILRSIPVSAMPPGLLANASKENSSREFLTHLNYDNLIVDEASRCLNHKSKRSLMVEQLAFRAKRTYLLSGTLCVGRPTDMFMPMNILDHDILNSNWTKFEKTYCVTSPYNKHIVIKYKNLDVLKKLVEPHILSKTREECLDLPDRIFVKRYYELSHEMVTLYNSIATSNEVPIGQGAINTELTIIKILKCLQVLNGFLYYDVESQSCTGCGNVVDCVIDDIKPGSDLCTREGAVKSVRKTWRFDENPKLNLLLEDLHDSDEKTIIWAWYQEDIAAIKKLLTENKISFIYASEQNSAQRYESDPSIRVFLGQTVQGIGITLNSATCTIYYSHGAALEPRLQSMDRNYRIGQTKPVVVKDYIAKGTVEEMLVYLLEHKTDVKKFMQENIGCFACESIFDCHSKNIEYLKKGCVHYGQRKNAEEKIKLKIWEIQ